VLGDLFEGFFDRPSALTCRAARTYHRRTVQRYYWFFGTSGRPGAEAV